MWLHIIGSIYQLLLWFWFGLSTSFMCPIPFPVFVQGCVPSLLSLLTLCVCVCLLLQSWSFLCIPNLFPAALRSVLVSLFSIRGCSLLLFCHLPYKKNKLFLWMRPSSFLSYYSNLPASVCHKLGSLRHLQEHVLCVCVLMCVHTIDKIRTLNR